MRMKFRMIVVMTSFTLLMSCSTPGKSPTQLASNFINNQDLTTHTKEIYPAKNPQQVALYTKDKTPHTAYRIIASAKVSKYNLLGMQREEATLHQMMKTLAASVGGDGLININNDKDHMQASVIAFQKILI